MKSLFVYQPFTDQQCADKEGDADCLPVQSAQQGRRVHDTGALQVLKTTNPDSDNPDSREFNIGC